MINQMKMSKRLTDHTSGLFSPTDPIQSLSPYLEKLVKLQAIINEENRIHTC